MSLPADFDIPPEFQDQLEPTRPLDPRTNEEIVQALTTFKRPVTSEKNIWAFWDRGFHAMPGWCQRNVIDWHRICDPSWSIRVLDLVPGSPNNVLKYLTPELLPKAMVDGLMDGPYSGQHSADFVRSAALILHGGVFMDVGIILTRSLDRICWSKLEDPSSPFQICVPLMYGTNIANHFVASRRADPFITRWHQLFLHVWETRSTMTGSPNTNYEGMCYNPLFAFAGELDYSAVAEKGYNWDWDVEPLRVLDYITQVIAWVRLTLLEDAGDGFSGVDYARNNILWTDVLSENWGFEKEIGFVGQDLYDLLATRRDTDPNSEEYKKAHKLVWHFLSQCSMHKITHSKNLLKKPALGVLWDANAGKDIEPGTFAELLRYGTVYFRQTREEIRFVEPEIPEQTMQKGVFEP
ncbi:hypothetical protein BJY00DRAFT_304630 [Aspergillus carlsbadensis]|nr:hypothetical protein BJY00DRAFT_304630 [Aspergillus carlsbadensis]